MEANQPQYPKALPFLFLTEMWERFGFYIVQGLLVLYMTGYFGFSDNESYSILGVFTALAYISPLVGGFVASRLLGYKNSVIWGGLFLIAGYALLALPYAKVLLYPALAVIIVGNGLFKPNISSLLGLQYTIDDPRRDAGFTIFYIGINIGVLLSGFSGYIKEYFGWRMSFALAAIGLTIGLCTFLLGLKHIKAQQSLPVIPGLKSKILSSAILAIIGLSFLMKINSLANWLLPIVGFILLIYLFFLTLQQEIGARKKMIVLNTLILSSIIFWMLFLQLFYSANLFVDRLVDKDFLGLHLTTTIFYASESIFIIILGPIFALLWQKLAHREQNPSPILKFAAGVLFAGLGFLILGIGSMYPNAQNLVNPMWVFCAYFAITIGELFLSPIGLSAVTLLSPPKLMGLMMGVWFVATGFGGIFAGWLAKLSSIPDSVQTVAGKLAIYQAAFLDYAYLAFVIAIALYFVHIAMRRLNVN